MQKQIVILLTMLSLILIVMGCQTSAPEAVRLSEEDMAAIKDVSHKYQQAVIAGDWDAWSDLWTEEAVYMIPNTPVIKGRAGIREFSGDFPAFPELSMTTDVIEGLSDLAFVHGTYSLLMPSDGEAEPMKDVGKYLWIVKKQPDGTWQIAAECYNSDLPVSK